MSETAAWQNYWRSGAQRCIPDCAALAESANAHWEDFARALPKRAKVVDLGTGAGAVLEELRKVRGDLKLFGVDSVGELPRPSEGCTLIPNVRMEHLPFGESTVDGVCSQFGFEYSDITKTVADIARVLRPGGHLQLLIHHSDGLVFAQNRSRSDALRWTLESGTFAMAARLVNARRLMHVPTPAAFKQAIITARRTFPGQPAAEEVLTGLLQRLLAGENTSPEEGEQQLLQLHQQVKLELVTLRALLRAAQDESAVARTTALLRECGLQIDAPTVLVEPTFGSPFGWLVRGRAAGPGKTA